MSDGGIVGQAYGRKIHAREVVAIDEAGDGLCWVRLTRFGDEWLLIRSDARDVSRAGGSSARYRRVSNRIGSRKSGREPARLPCPRGAGRRRHLRTVHRCAGGRSPPAPSPPSVAREPSPRPLKR